MAMGNYCYAQGIECSYATTYGTCFDDIYEDYGLCEMLGDEMPPKELSTEDRIKWIISNKNKILKGKVMDRTAYNNSLCVKCNNDVCKVYGSRCKKYRIIYFFKKLFCKHNYKKITRQDAPLNKRQSPLSGYYQPRFDIDEKSGKIICNK